MAVPASEKDVPGGRKKTCPCFPENVSRFFGKRGHVFLFFVQKIGRYYLSILNQSISTHPPSLVLMVGRVQKVPTLAPIHLPSFT